MRIFLAIGLLAFSCSPAFAQEWAKQKLEKSPRHSEWVTIKSGDRDLKAFIAYPEKKEKAISVLLIHEIFGLTDWVRLTADQLAAEGFIAIAPDLLSGMGPHKTGTADFGGDDGVRKAISQLLPDQITTDLIAVKKYLSAVPAANGKIAVAGFCWGGSQTFRFATNCGDIKEAHVFYGTAPTNENALAKISAPVYGYYAEYDARVGATLDGTMSMMKKLNKFYETKTYPGAGHGFMRAGEAPDANEENKAARAAAWDRLTKHLHAL